MLTSRYRPDPRFVAKVLAWLMVVGMYALGPVPLFRAASTRAPPADDARPPITTPLSEEQKAEQERNQQGMEKLKAENRLWKTLPAGPRVTEGPRLEDLPQQPPPSPPAASARPVATDGPPSSATEDVRLVSLASYGAGYAPSGVWNINPSYSQLGNMRVTVYNSSGTAWPANGVALSYHLYKWNGSTYPLYNYNGLATVIPIAVPCCNASLDVYAQVERLPAGTFKIAFDMMDLTDPYNNRFFTDAGGVPASQAVQFTVPHYPPTGQLIGPLQGATVDTRFPQLRAGVSSDGTPSTDGQFEICPDSNMSGSSCVASQWYFANSSVGLDAALNWTVPTGAMPTWNVAYYWGLRLQDTSNGTTSQWASSIVYPVVPAQPGSGRFGVDPAALDGAGVNMWLGNYTRQENDLVVAGPTGSLPLQLSRVYNSANGLVGGFGTGWSSLLDVSLQLTGGAGTNGATVTFADGKQSNFGQNLDGSWAPAYGEDSASVFSSNTGNYVLDFGNGTRYVFNYVGANLPEPLGQMIAPNGDTLTLTKSGNVTQITDSLSTRSLYVTWNGNHVSTVSTATTGGLTWNYTYLGDLLTQVCDAETSPPGGNCTKYSYGAVGPLTYRANTGMCVDVDAQNAAPYHNAPDNLKKIQVWGCNGYQGQQFTLYPTNTANNYTLHVLDKCLDIAGNSSQTTTRVELYDCNGVGGQVWVPQTDGSLLNPQSGLCLDLPYGDTTPGRYQLQIYGCNHQDPQKWNVPSGTPRLVSVQRPKSDNLTTIDYYGAYVTRVGDGWDGGSQSYPNSWYYNRTNLDPNTNYGKVLNLQVTDPSANGSLSPAVNLGYEFDQRGELVDRWVAANSTGNIRYWTYDYQGRAKTMKDENNNITTYAWDSKTGALASVTRPHDSNANTYSTTSYGYVGDTVNDQRFGREPTSVTANGNAVTMTYNNGRLATRKTPPTASAPSGATTTYAYTCDSGPAPAAFNGSGTQPCGLLARVTDPDGHVTTYDYNQYGDATREITPSGRTTQSSYDNLGWMSSQTVSSSSQAAGTTWFYYNNSGQVTYEYDPSVTNPVTGAGHARDVANTYDGDGNLTQLELSDDYGSDASRTTTYTYDNHDRRASTLVNNQSGAQQQVSATVYNGVGHVLRSYDANNAEYDYQYDVFGMLLWITLVNPGGGAQPVRMATYTYDNAGRMSTSKSALNQEVDYTYYNDDLLKTQIARNYYDPYMGSTRDITLHSYQYDLAGNVTQDAQGPSGSVRTTNYGYDFANQRTSMTADPYGPSPRTTAYTFDPAGLLLTTTLSGSAPAQTTTNTYHPTTGALTQTTVTNGPGNLSTLYVRDGQNLLSSTNPRGGYNGDLLYTTTNTYDALGRPSTTQGPQVTVEDGTGNVSYNVRPTTTFGYDTYGKVTQVQDPRGNRTNITYDNRGQRTQVQNPNYWTPAGNYTYSAENWTYDNAGNVSNYSDPRGATTNYYYDMRNRPYQVTLPAASTNGPRPIVQMTYDDDSNLTSLLDPFGARTNQTFDTLGRRATSTQVVRQPSTQNYTTYYRYDDFGGVISTYNAGFEADKTYNAFGEVATETSTGRGTTTYAYDQAGHLTSVTDPISRRTANQYDQAGRMTSVQHYAVNGAQVDSTTYGYDGAGNQISKQDPRGNYWTSAYDGANHLTSRTDPYTYDANNNYQPSAVTSMGYDATGNRTRVTDGNGNATLQTYQSWNLPLALLEPWTQANQTDRTSTITYDAAGSPTLVSKPGGISQTASYDNRGRRTGLTATGGDGNAYKTFTYDDADRMTSAGQSLTSSTGPFATQNFSYEDRGMILSSSGPQGSASYSYDSLGRLTSQTDPAATVTQTYSGISDLATLYDSLTGTTRNYTRDLAGQVTTEQYKLGTTTGASRNYTYDGVGRIATDTTKLGSTTTASTAYSRDPNGNLTQVVASGSQIYSRTTQINTYDAANRLTSYQVSDPIAGYTNGQNYTWDAAGNRKTLNTTTATYDQRNRLLSTSNPSVSSTNTWSARGTLASTTTTWTNYAPNTATNQFDAFDRAIGQAGGAYTYDALDRLSSVGGRTFQYAGLSAEPSTDGSYSIARSGDGTPIASQSAPQYNQTAKGLQSNVHGDVTIMVNTLTGDIRGNFNWDPFGNKNVSDGADSTSAGFQGSWTDYNGMVSAQARWYNPQTGNFLSKDPGPQPMTNAPSINNYGYGNANPATYSDPTGHWSIDWGSVGRGISRIGQGLNFAAKAFGGMRFNLPMGSVGDLFEGSGAITDGSLTFLRSANWSTLLRGFLQIGGGGSWGLGPALRFGGYAALGALLGYGAFELYNWAFPDPRDSYDPKGGSQGPCSGPYGYRPASGAGGFNPCGGGNSLQPRTPQTQTQNPAQPQKPRPVAPPPPWIVRTTNSSKTTTWQSTTKYWDDTYVYNRTDNYSQTFTDQKTYYSDGSWKYRWQRTGVSDSWTITSRLLIDLSNPIMAATPQAGPAMAPTGPDFAPNDGVCGKGGSIATCASSGGGALPPQAIGYSSTPGSTPGPRASNGCGDALSGPWLAPACSGTGGAGSYMNDRRAKMLAGRAGADGAFLGVIVAP